MAKDFPRLHTCGAPLRRRYTAPSVIYNSAGFYSTDVSHFQKQLGAEKFAKFEAKRQAAEKRAHTGMLSNYEKVLETI